MKNRTCKNCGKNYHYCSACGIESFHSDYCSTKCLFEAGYVICDKCDCGGFAEYCDEDCSGYRVKKDGEKQSKTFDEAFSDMRERESRLLTKPIIIDWKE